MRSSLLPAPIKIEKLATHFAFWRTIFLYLSAHLISARNCLIDARFDGRRERHGRGKRQGSWSPSQWGGSFSRREKQRYFHVTIQLRKWNLLVRLHCSFSLYVITVWRKSSPSRSTIETPMDIWLSKHFNLLPVTTLTRPATVLKPSCSKLLTVYARICLRACMYATLLHFVWY